jgi:hypothetical protein
MSLEIYNNDELRVQEKSSIILRYNWRNVPTGESEKADAKQGNVDGP